LHVELTWWAFRVCPIAGLMLAVATRRDPRFRPVAAKSWLLLAFALAVYVTVMGWGPRPGTDFGLVFQVTAQKTIVILAEIVVVFETYEAERALEQPHDEHLMESK